MKIFLDCLPCILRQVLEASRLVTDKSDLQAIIMEESIKILSDYKKYQLLTGNRIMHAQSCKRAYR
jgi:uncharacterized protein with ATP-grasp and redox domains